MSDKYNGAGVLENWSAKQDLIIICFSELNLISLFPTSPQIANQGSCMVPNLIPAHLSKKPHHIGIITKYDDPNILNILAQEILWPKDSVLRPGVVPVASESMDKH